MLLNKKEKKIFFLLLFEQVWRFGLLKKTKQQDTQQEYKYLESHRTRISDVWKVSLNYSQ